MTAVLGPFVPPWSGRRLPSSPASRGRMGSVESAARGSGGRTDDVMVSVANPGTWKRVDGPSASPPQEDAAKPRVHVGLNNRQRPTLPPPPDSLLLPIPVSLRSRPPQAWPVPSPCRVWLRIHCEKEAKVRHWRKGN